MKKKLCFFMMGIVVLFFATGVRTFFLRVPSFEKKPSQGVWGVYHVHSNASHDSFLSVATMASVAHTQTIDFVVLTDHNVLSYDSFQKKNVWFLSWPERSTKQGHVVRVDASASTLYAAHPVSKKRPFVGDVSSMQGMEIASASSVLFNKAGFLGWRWWPYVWVLPWKPELFLWQLSQLEESNVSLWDSVQKPSFPGLCAVDAHSWMPFSWASMPWRLWVPGVTHVKDPAQVQEAVAQGAVHCVVGWMGKPRAVLWDVVLAQGMHRQASGGTYRSNEVEALVFSLEGLKHEDVAHVRMLRDGKEVLRVRDTTLRYEHPSPGMYRVEAYVWVPGFWGGVREVPAVVSGRVWVRG